MKEKKYTCDICHEEHDLSELTYCFPPILFSAQIHLISKLHLTENVNLSSAFIIAYLLKKDNQNSIYITDVTNEISNNALITILQYCFLHIIF